MIFITGPGRSGTSVLALFCKQMGINPGGAWHNSVDAGLEDEQLVQIDDALLGELRRTGSVAGAVDRLGNQMSGLERQVAKDPRLTIHPGLLRAWASVRSDVRVVLAYRHPEDCVASRVRSSRQLRIREKETADGFRRALADTVEVLLELEIPFQLLLYPHFLQRFDRVYEAFTQLGIVLDKQAAEATWNAIVDPTKVHVGASRLDGAPPGPRGLFRRRPS